MAFTDLHEIEDMFAVLVVPQLAKDASTVFRRTGTLPEERKVGTPVQDRMARWAQTKANYWAARQARNAARRVGTPARVTVRLA